MTDTKEASPANDLPTVVKHRHCEACGVVAYRGPGRLCAKCENPEADAWTALGRLETPRERLSIQAQTMGTLRNDIERLKLEHEKRLRELEILARRMEDALIRASVGGKA